MDYRSLARLARAAKKHSHSPFSRFRVGAAVLSAGGKVFTGCNVENSSYGLSVCAERTALFKAISEGERKFTAIAVATDMDEFISPCGACRQVIGDLAPRATIVLVNARGATRILPFGELLPHPFGPGQLRRRRR